MDSKRKKKTRKRRPRLPLEALRKVGSRAMTTKKGLKGYERRREKKLATETIEGEAPPEGS